MLIGLGGGKSGAFDPEMLETRLDIRCKIVDSEASCWHGEGQIVENTCKYTKPGPQHLLLKSRGYCSSIHRRGYCNWTSLAAAATGPFFSVGGLCDSLVGPNFTEKGLLNCQTLGRAALLDQGFDCLEAVNACLFNARILCLPGLWQGPPANIFGPIEDDDLLSLIKFGL